MCIMYQIHACWFPNNMPRWKIEQYNSVEEAREGQALRPLLLPGNKFLLKAPFKARWKEAEEVFQVLRK